MRRSFVNRFVLLAGVFVVAALAPGCALFNSVNQPQITVQMGTGLMLHVAAIPQVLPDGTPAKEQREKLLEEVALNAGGYTLIENVLGGWVPPGQSEVYKERNDLLLVKGQPQVGYILRARLIEDFKQQAPFVESVPLQAIAVLRPGDPAMEPPTEEEVAAATAEAE